MKNITVKKIVLCSIGAFASLLLLIGLAFPVLAYDMGLGDAVNDAMGQAGMTANGFAMLSFEFPTLLAASLSAYAESDFIELFGILLGVTSLLTLVAAILSLGVAVYAFFRFSTGKCAKIFTWLLIAGLAISLVHAAVAIFFASNVQSLMVKAFEKLSEALGVEQEVIGSFTTTAFVSSIFQAVCLTAYLICANKIPEKELNGQEKTAAEKPKANEKEEAASKEKALQSIIKAELTLVKLLKGYKELYDGAILSTADYIDKKVKILQYSEKRIQSALPAIVNKCSFEGIVQAEGTVIEVLKEYKALLDAGVISDADFVQKKVSLLGYIIN